MADRSHLEDQPAATRVDALQRARTHPHSDREPRVRGSVPLGAQTTKIRDDQNERPVGLPAVRLRASRYGGQVAFFAFFVVNVV